jgi:UrcA family protein
LAAGLALATAPTLAHAQTTTHAKTTTNAPTVTETTTGELIVTAPAAGPNARSLSAPVSFRDLDLTTPAGRDTLSQRIQTTARDLCRKMGEPRTRVPPAPSCERAAIDGTRAQQRTAIAQATPKAAR